LTEPYPLEKQVRLYNNMKKLNKKLFTYLSKTDLLGKDEIKEFSKKFRIKDVDELKKSLI